MYIDVTLSALEREGSVVPELTARPNKNNQDKVREGRGVLTTKVCR